MSVTELRRLLFPPASKLRFVDFQFTKNKFGRPLVKFEFTNESGEPFVSSYPPDRRD